jgi:hypothetical protein
LKNGIHLNVPRAAYDELTDRVNYSTLKLFDRSAFHYKHAIDERDREKEEDPEGESDTLVGGQLVHTLALEPHLLDQQYAVWEKSRGRRDARTEPYKKFLAEAAIAKKTIVTDEQLEHARGIADAIRTSPAAAPYIVGGSREVTVLWDYDEPQVGAIDGWTMPMRARLDYVTDAAMIDLKSAVSAKAEDFQRAAWNLGYFSQAAMQLDGFCAITRRVRPYLWLVVEKKPPYAVAVYEPSKEGLELGRRRYQEWIRTLHVCRETGVYPGYTEAPMQLDPPGWAMRRAEEELVLE